MGFFCARLKNAYDRILQGANLYGEDQGPHSRRSIVLSGLVYNVVISVLNGTYLAGFCLTLGGTANDVNMIVIIMSVCNLVQIISPMFLGKLKSRKQILILLRAAAHLVNVVALPLLALTGIPKPILFPIAAVLLGLAQCLLAFIGPGMTVWHIGCIPPEKQLGHFSFFTVVNCITTYVALFLSGLLADGLVGALGEGLGLTLLRMSMLVLAALDIFFLTRIHEYPPKDEKTQSIGRFFLKMGQCVRDCPSYVKTIAVASIWNLVANIPSQYYNTYLLEDLHLSFTFLNSITLFNVVVVLVFTPLWKKFIQWKGLRGCLFLSVLCYAPHALGLALVGSDTVFLYPVSIIYNLIFAAGINLSFSVVPYLNLPEEHRTIYMAVYNTSCALSALLGVLFGRVIFSLLQGAGDINLFGGLIAPARILVFVLALALAGAAFLFHRLLRNCGA